MKKGDIFECTIEKIAYKGMGMAYVPQKDGGALTMFIPDTVPGDKVEAMFLKKKKKTGEAKKRRLLSHTARTATAPCPSFGICGGCLWQNIPYEQQLAYKKGFIEESLSYIGKITSLPEVNMLPSPEPFYYRNKIELSFGLQKFVPQDEVGGEKEEGVFLGYHGRGSFYKIVDIDSCTLVDPIFDAFLACIKLFIRTKKLSAYNAHTHEGFLRHIVFRHGVNTGEVMIHIVTTSTDEYTLDFWEPLVEQLRMQERDDIKIESILWTQNDNLSDTVAGTPQVVFGREYIFDKIGQFLFKISAFSFFQTNTKGAEVLYDQVKKQANIQGGETIVDLYAGTGTIGMYLASDAKKVFSVEENKGAVDDAKTNAVLNNIHSIEFLCGKVEKDAFPLLFERPDVVIIDPPRAGMHPKALEMLPQFGSQKIIYVSCNPTTLARDIEYLSKWYDLTEVTGVDMFPQTYHIETVCTLVKKGS